MITHRIARPLLAGVFVANGLDSLLHPESNLGSPPTPSPLARMLGHEKDTVSTVRAAGALQFGAGLLLAVGFLPRSMAVALATSLAPTTMANNAFWRETQPGPRREQRTQFLKDASTLGGLVLAATDKNGRPSLGWLARRSMKRTTQALGRRVGELTDVSSTIAQRGVEKVSAAMPA